MKLHRYAAAFLVLVCCAGRVPGPAVAADADAAVTYKVAVGDSIWLIARKFATTMAELRRLNNLTTNLIFPGATLVVSRPASGDAHLYVTYTILRGDTLGKIAEKFGTSVEFIRSLNGIWTDLIYAGDTLKIPAPPQPILPPAPEVTPTIPPPVPTPSKEYFAYTVARGDTVWTIAGKFGLPMQEVLSDNGLNTESVLNLGQSLRIARWTVPVKPTPGARYGEYLDWWTEAQYVVPIGRDVRIVDFETGQDFTIRRTVGAGHADCEPLTAADTLAAAALFGGFTWTPRAVIAETDGRRIAASMSFYPHDVSYILDNGFDGHFDLYFANCIRHADGLPDASHQAMVETAAGR